MQDHLPFQRYKPMPLSLNSYLRFDRHAKSCQGGETLWHNNNNNNHISRDISHLLIESPIKRGKKRKISVIQGSNWKKTFSYLYIYIISLNNIIEP